MYQTVYLKHFIAISLLVHIGSEIVHAIDDRIYLIVMLRYWTKR